MSKAHLPVKFARVNLSAQDGGLFKRSLLCREGLFDGMYGEIKVTSALLNKLANAYNSQRASVQNENDYAPILLDHEQKVDNVKGRLMAPLTVETWTNPENGEEVDGLYGDIRVDDEGAKAKVVSGLYSQLSISFDEDSGEIYEVSFVAIEAARRSQVLSKGDKQMDYEKLYKEMVAKETESKKRSLAMRKARKSTVESLSANVATIKTEIADGSVKALAAAKKLRIAALAGQFRGFVKAGKLPLVEFNALKMDDLSALPAAALGALVASYEARPVSTDFVQHGQQGAKPVDIATTSAERTRELMKLQREGKKVALSEGGADDKEKLEMSDEERAAFATGSDLKLEDVQGAIAVVDEMKAKMDEWTAKFAELSELLGKLNGTGEDAEPKTEEGVI